MASEAALVICLLLVFLVAGLPIAVSLGLSGALGLWLLDFPPLIVIQRLSAGTESFVLLAIPFFILSGAIMESGGMSRRLVNFADSLVGFLPGGLANANIGASMVFGGISGSSVADTSAVGSVMIPQMERQGYSQVFSASVTAAASPIGMIIPPSIPMIVWSFISGQSLNELFLGGIVPGLLIGVVLMAISTVLCLMHGFQAEFGRFSLRRLASGAKDGLLALGAPVIIIGGIVSGVFTPTEASVAACVYAMVLGLLVYKEIKWSDLPRIGWETMLFTIRIMFIISVAGFFGWLLIFQTIPQQVIAELTALGTSLNVVMAIFIFILLILGCFMEGIAVIVITVPVFMPIVAQYGIDPVQFGVVMILCSMIGLLTPPVGMCLYTMSSISGVPIGELSRELMPYIIGITLVTLICAYCPGLVLWVPRMFS